MVPCAASFTAFDGRAYAQLVWLVAALVIRIVDRWDARRLRAGKPVVGILKNRPQAYRESGSR